MSPSLSSLVRLEKYVWVIHYWITHLTCQVKLTHTHTHTHFCFIQILRASESSALRDSRRRRPLMDWRPLLGPSDPPVCSSISSGQLTSWVKPQDAVHEQ